MTADIKPIDIHELKSTPLESATFGQRLQSARHAMNFEAKDIASQLRLNEKIILMMENNDFNNHIAPTFMKGYLRSYAKLVNIPEHEVKIVTDNIKQEPASQRPNIKPVMTTHRNNDRVSHHFMNIFTALIVFTLVGLIGTWWYSHNKPGVLAIASNQVAHMLNTTEAPLPLQIAANDSTPSVTATNSAPTTPDAAPVTPPTELTIQPDNAAPTKISNTTNNPVKTEPSSKFDDDDDLDSDM